MHGVISLIVAIIGVSRAWRTSTVRRIVSIVAVVFMILSTAYILMLVKAWDDPLRPLLALLGLVGIVMFIINGLTSLGKKE